MAGGLKVGSFIAQNCKSPLFRTINGIAAINFTDSLFENQLFLLRTGARVHQPIAARGFVRGDDFANQQVWLTQIRRASFCAAVFVL